MFDLSTVQLCLDLMERLGEHCIMDSKGQSDMEWLVV